MSSPSFDLTLTFQGQSVTLPDVTLATTGETLHEQARHLFGLDNGDAAVKLLYKGKLVTPDHSIVFASLPPKSKRKILIMASSQQDLADINSKRSDPTIRGFDQEKAPQTIEKYAPWGPQNSCQDDNYKFCRFQACTWQSFGHGRSKMPHAFQAMQILEQLATDPGVVKIMQERQLVVNTLGEMDPIDDRIKQKHEAKGSSCLLGYNTNRGLRIDVKLRHANLDKGFLPYPQVVSTLIHELSHNWVSEHNLLFWTNYGQMRVEYLHKHATLAASGELVNGKTTAELAGVRVTGDIKDIAKVVLKELEQEMKEHGLHSQSIAPAIVERCRELTQEYEQSEQGQKVGGSLNGMSSARERALAAAEQRAKEQQRDDGKEEKK